MNIRNSLLTLALLALVWIPCARAESVIAIPRPAQLNPAGGTLVLDVQVLYRGQPGALGLELALPTGWSFGGTEGDLAPEIAPRRGATDQVECAWTNPPADGAAFALALVYPAGSDVRILTGRALLRRDGKQLELAMTVPVGR